MIGIIGYGRFGRLAARHLAGNYPVFVCGRRDLSPENMPPNVHAGSFHDVCRQRIVIPCMPISSFKEVLAAAGPLLRPDALVADVCSVKEKPVKWMKAILPETVSILGTHPMFGPDSASSGLSGMKIAVCRVRIADDHYGKVVSFLKRSGLEVIETTPAEHDRQIAVSLALTHFIGRSLAAFGARELAIDTEGYKRLLHILDVVEHDTLQLFTDMHRYNPHAKEMRTAFMRAMAKVESVLNE
ncbi:MAG: prephenate dehydrogenase/arogenate dehydrogenase family protein [Desulfobacterales bacterium]